MTYAAISEYFLLGKTLKSHGTAGRLRIMIEDQYKAYLRKDAFVFFDLNGSKVPFRISETEEGAHFVLALEDISDKKDSDFLSGRELWVPLESVKSRHQRSPRNIKNKWSEYRIEDELTKTIYTILRVEEFPQQLMAVIMINEKESLIPLSDQLITNIDKENKLIKMNIPEGLLDL